MGGACRKLLSAPEGSPSQLSLQRVFAQFLEGTRSHLRFDHLGLGFYDRSQQVLELTLQAGDERVPTQVPVLPESLGALLDEAEAIEVCDVENDRWFPDLLELAESHGFRSFRIVPLTAGDQVFGAVTVLRRTAGAFSEENVRHLN